MIINNVKMVLADQVIDGSIEIEMGNIRAIDSKNSQQPSAIDGEGAWLMPGLIELHTDNLEKYFTPRPKVNWPAMSAMSAHDKQLIGSGITTVLDAVAIGDVRDGGTRQKIVSDMVETITESENRGVNRAEHLLHVRCELPNSDTAEQAEQYVRLPNLRMISVMDHSPGQRQFVNLEKYRTYYQGKYGFSDTQMSDFEREQRQRSQQFSQTNRLAIASLCKQYGITLASHDDATHDHADESAEIGASMAEFPTTLAAAKRSHEHGMNVLMGAPNIVRGGSHSGNIAAKSLAQAGVLDLLSSDYFPHSLLDAIFTLADDSQTPHDLVQATRLATINAANTLGLEDRGEIAVGKLADIILVKQHAGQAYVEHAYKRGRRVF